MSPDKDDAVFQPLGRPGISKIASILGNRTDGRFADAADGLADDVRLPITRLLKTLNAVLDEDEKADGVSLACEIFLSASGGMANALAEFVQSLRSRSEAFEHILDDATLATALGDQLYAALRTRRGYVHHSDDPGDGT